MYERGTDIADQHTYKTEKENTNTIVDDVLKYYKETQSIRGTVKGAKCSWPRVVKILASNGVVINDVHNLILKMHDEGKTIDEIAKQTGYNPKTIQAYLPAVRPVYGVNPSVNAQRIQICRSKHIK